MGVVTLHANGEVEVVVPSTPEECARADAALIRIVEAMARADARRDYDAALAEAAKRWRGATWDDGKVPSGDGA